MCMSAPLCNARAMRDLCRTRINDVTYAIARLQVRTECTFFEERSHHHQSTVEPRSDHTSHATPYTAPIAHSHQVVGVSPIRSASAPATIAETPIASVARP